MNTLTGCSRVTLVGLIAACVSPPPAIAQRTITQKDCRVCGGDTSQFAVPNGLPPIEWPADNPYSNVKATLGKLLFFDPRLSSDGTISCASCHSSQAVFGDGAAVSTGIRAQEGTRNAPTVINSVYNTSHSGTDGRTRWKLRHSDLLSIL